jgi:hypothetical protein
MQGASTGHWGACLRDEFQAGDQVPLPVAAEARLLTAQKCGVSLRVRHSPVEDAVPDGSPFQSWTSNGAASEGTLHHHMRREGPHDIPR